MDQEISVLASEFQELQDAAGQWRRGNTVHLQMPMTTRQQEAVSGCWMDFFLVLWWAWSLMISVSFEHDCLLGSLQFSSGDIKIYHVPAY